LHRVRGRRGRVLLRAAHVHRCDAQPCGPERFLARDRVLGPCRTRAARARDPRARLLSTVRDEAHRAVAEVFDRFGPTAVEHTELREPAVRLDRLRAPEVSEHVAMTLLFAATQHIKGPHIDWAALSPFVALTVGALVVLLVGLLPPVSVRERVVPVLSAATLAAAIAFEITRINHPRTIISGALRVDGLAVVLDLIFTTSALAVVLLSLREEAPRQAGHGEFH